MATVSQTLESIDEKAFRPLANFPPSVWGDHFLHYPTSLPSTLEDFDTPRIKELKEKVKAMFRENESVLAKTLRLIDHLEHLGLAYNFEDEIDKSLKRILNDDYEDTSDIGMVALRFRLLRHNGYYVSADVFEKFTDREGKFKQELSCDAEGLLQLYEASWLATHEEKILEDAKDFAKLHMDKLLSSAQYNTIHANHDSAENNMFVAKKMKRALEMPFHLGMRRIEARYFIENVYKYYEQHEYSNNHRVLLELAKLDFNHLQSLHQAELKELTVWWKDLGITKKLSFLRDRLVEMYFWNLVAHFEPKYSQVRMIFTKLMNTMPATDDIFDAYGTLPELELLNDVYQRWDLEDVDKLPEYMKVYLTFYRSVIREIEDELIRKGRLYAMHYYKEAFKTLVRAYYKEAQWMNDDYIPTLEVYIRNGIQSCAHPFLICAFAVIMADDKEAVTHEALEWVLGVPKIVEGSAVVTRLMDDLACTKYEQERKHVASCVQCYMNQHGVPEEDARVVLRKTVADAWKDINEGYVDPCPYKKYVNRVTIDFTRIVHVVYTPEDSGLTLDPKGNTKKIIAALLVHPIQD